MSERPTAPTADQERKCIVLSVALSCWRRPSGNRVELPEFFDMVRRASDCLDKERPDIQARINLSDSKIKTIINEMKGKRWIEEERLDETVTLKFTTPAGHQISKELPDLCKDLELRAAIRRACERVVEFHTKMINPGDCD